MIDHTENMDYSEQTRVRREKLFSLQANGRDPFAITTFEQTHRSSAVKAEFERRETENPETAGFEVSVAGRVVLQTY
ncbi:hypothetical protein FACS1894200_02200 [Spirochaetia bacterium]|nr:hypothetical protein FACS1894200_02200 [Spirochaetia bacterium]